MPRFLVAFTVLFTILAVFGNIQADEWKTGYTTDNLQEQFINKCLEFGLLYRTSEIYDDKKFNDEGCKNIWNKFIGVIDGKEKDTVRQGYRDFFKYIEDNFYRKDFKESYFEDKVAFKLSPRA